MYPELKITKAQVIEYYVRMAPKMLGILTDRPVVLTRYPDGVDKEGFYEKDAPLGTPRWVRMFKRYSETAKRELNYVICNDLDTLVWLANLATIELHITLYTVKEVEKPDLVLFDIDPSPPANMNDVVDTALLLKEKLDSLNLRSFVKTSGKAGLHVIVPILPEYTFSQTREFVHVVGKYLARESSKIVSEASKTEKPGTVNVDYLQNSHGRTVVCPYSLRPTSQATVSMPISWKDVKKGLKPEDFTLFTAVKSENNHWGTLFDDRQKLEWSV
jgi:bifunctional non-homologous end joining protein LigD